MVSMVSPSPVVHLLIPPYTSPMVPNLGVPSLAGDLRQRGIEVHQTDLNIRFHDELLNAPFLLDAINRYCYEQFRQLNNEPFLESREAVLYLDALQKLCNAQILSHRQQKIAQLCQLPVPELEPLPFGYPTQAEAFRLSGLGAAMLGAQRMVLGERIGSGMKEPTGLAAEMLETLFRKYLSPEHIRRVTLFGISVLYGDQIGCALFMARYLREWFPGIPIVAGGPYVSRLACEANLGIVGDYFDVIVVREGEQSLASLCQNHALFKGRSRRGVQILDLKGTGTPLPTPFFFDQELELYWGRPLMLPIQASRGCYWGRCAFCSYRNCYSSPYRSVSATRMVNQIRQLQQAHGCGRFELIDDCVSPRFLLEFAHALVELPAPIHWSASVRFEHRLDAHVLERIGQAGCRRLTFGMETVNQRLLDYIRKGTRAEDYLPILQACKKAGIEVHLNWIAGLPSETPEELDQTVQWLREHDDLFTYQFGHVFTLEQGSPFANRPKDFGLPANVLTMPFHLPKEKARLWSIINSVSIPQGQLPTPAQRKCDNHPLRWSDRTVRVRIDFDLDEIRHLIRVGAGQVKRLEEGEWLVYDAQSEQSVELSKNCLAWLESCLGKTSLDDQARETIGVLYEQGILE